MNALELDDDRPEQRQLREQAHRFAVEVLRPASVELDALSAEEAIAPQSRLWDVFRQAYRAGHYLRGFPPEMGGTGGPAETLSPAAATRWRREQSS